EFLEFQRRAAGLGRLRRLVVAGRADGAGENDGDPGVLLVAFVRHSMILVTTPAPTVLPPSRMAKRICSSRATVVISSTSTVTLSPGITILMPSGSITEPVTSVVRM